jgi:hypothetical protein
MNSILLIIRLLSCCDFVPIERLDSGNRCEFVVEIMLNIGFALGYFLTSLLNIEVHYQLKCSFAFQVGVLQSNQSSFLKELRSYCK